MVVPPAPNLGQSIGVSSNADPNDFFCCVCTIVIVRHKDSENFTSPLKIYKFKLCEKENECSLVIIKFGAAVLTVVADKT